MSLGAITIDVDSIRCYRAIHGLPDAPLDEDPIYTTAVPRFIALLEEVGCPATFFLIGADAPAHADAFAPLAELGCEVASHSHEHDYRLSTRAASEIAADLDTADEALRPLAPDGRVHGFRAPGYNTSPAMLEAVAARGYRYDSSLLPSPLYFAARAAAIASYRLRGRTSSSLVGRAEAFAGPRAPYRTTAARPWRRDRRGPLLELPMAVDPLTRTPLIGTFLATMPRAVFDGMVDLALMRSRLFNFELHAIDLLDETDEGVPAEVAAAQPDLRVPFAEKRDRFSRLFEKLKTRTRVATLATHAGLLVANS